MNPSIRTALREGTRAAHENVERLFGVFDLTTVEGYHDFLLAQAAALIPIETSLTDAGAEQWLRDWPARCRAGALSTDLSLLNVERTAGIDVRPLRTREEKLGALYVLEGSRLGAAVLLKIVETSRIDVGQATFFLRHGVGHSFWTTFLPSLETVGAECDRRLLLDAVLRTFDSFARAAALISRLKNESALPTKKRKLAEIAS